jgi:glycosyltransferase involved in cell wall biosynthesis
MNSMNDTVAGPAYSFVIPTYKRPDVLAQCLQHIADLDYDQSQIEVWVIDNGETQHCKTVGMQFTHSLDIRYIVNPMNLGPVGSLNKGLCLEEKELSYRTMMLWFLRIFSSDATKFSPRMRRLVVSDFERLSKATGMMEDVLERSIVRGE